MQQGAPSNELFTIAHGPNQGRCDALTQQELGEYVSLTYESRRSEWLAGRLAAKQAIASRFAIPRLSDVRLETRTGQAPIALAECDGGWNPLPATISISHAGGWCIAAVTDATCRIGVDIDRLDAVKIAHARYFLTPREMERVTAANAAMLWVQKEAAWKAFCLGAADPFQSLELDWDYRLFAAVVHGTRVPVAASVWAPAPGLIAAAIWTTKELA